MTKLLLLLILLLCSCTSFTQEQRYGYAHFNTAFEMLPNVEEQRLVLLKNVLIIIRPNNTTMSNTHGGLNVLGIAHKTNIIEVVGKMRGDKIYVNPAILGHEMMHLMTFDDEDFYNPDKE